MFKQKPYKTIDELIAITTDNNNKLIEKFNQLAQKQQGLKIDKLEKETTGHTVLKTNIQGDYRDTTVEIFICNITGETKVHDGERFVFRSKKESTDPITFVTKLAVKNGLTA